MDRYDAPINDIVGALRTAGIASVLDLPIHASLDLGAIRDVLEGFGKLASDVIAPTDRIGDTVGARFDRETGAVAIPDELAEAFRQYVDGGWQGLAGSPEYGGGGFPRAVATAVHEMFGSANLALSLNPMLTQSGIELLELWGDERQREVVLPRLIDGSWSGTMNLTEPDAGSDLGAVRTTATPLSDGRWAITGTKIFITWGEHDLCENIIHLVLARAPGAPAGTKGISVFVVPKFVVDDDGRPGERNAVYCRGLEHKLGIHASPTCVIEFVDAIGELVGPLHGGMNAMFSMMNPARLAIGLQGVSVGECCYQQALSYALQRRQGRADGIAGPAPLIEHPDVQRMLLDIASTRDAARLLTYATSVAGDLARGHLDHDVRSNFQRRADLLTPLAKAWPTDQGVRLASLAIQIYGGMGFIEETGVAQRYRDVRISPIYEGTNGIQAIDLVNRKIAQDNGAAVAELFGEIEQTANEALAIPQMRATGTQLADALAAARHATDWVSSQSGRDRHAVLAGACAYLDLLATTFAGHLMLRHALADLGEGNARSARSVARAQYFGISHLEHRPTFAAITVGLTPLRDGLT